eukprot:scaffold17915_cov41-Cyclotella_meneghiniana.AAC.2
MTVLGRNFIDDGGGEIVSLIFCTRKSLSPVRDRGKEPVLLHRFETEDEVRFSRWRSVPCRKLGYWTCEWSGSRSRCGCRCLILHSVECFNKGLALLLH